MRRIGRLAAIFAVVATRAVALWRRNPRIGTRFMNDTVDPFLVRRGISGSGRAEVGTLEHVGRRSGRRYLTPVHPEPTADGFRIIVSLGLRSEWAQNVLSAGHCRLQIHDTVYELDEPALLLPRAMAELPAATRWVCGLLGFVYLRLHRSAERPGTLEEEGDVLQAAPTGPVSESGAVVQREPVAIEAPALAGGKYGPLRDRLVGVSGPIELTFEEVAGLVGGLPSSAYRYPQWWENEQRGAHVQARAWLTVGRHVASVDLAHQRVVFA
jgi:hypothetical protein